MSDINQQLNLGLEVYIYLKKNGMTKRDFPLISKYVRELFKLNETLKPENPEVKL